MSSKTTYLATLATLAGVLAKHQGVTHSAISMRIFGKGDFFQKFFAGKRKSLSVDTWFKAMLWFHENWPIDLEWPSDITRPSASSEDAA